MKNKILRIFTLLLLIAVGVTFSLSEMTVDVSAASKYPGKVYGVKAVSAGHDAIKVSWNKVSGATGYKVYRSTKKSSGFKCVKTTKYTSWTNTSRTSNKTYYYKIKAYKKSGKKTYKSKKYSSRVYAKAYLTTASGIKATSNGYNSIKLTWNAGKNAKYYQIYRATSKSGKYSRIATTTSRSYVNSGLTTNKNYYYKIRAYNKRGSKTQYSGYSGYVYTKPIPATPTNVAAAASTENITVSWDAVSGTSKYYIYRNDGKVFSTTKTSFVDNTAALGSSYSYRVRAYRTVYSAYSVYSNAVSLIEIVPEEPVVAPSEAAYLNYSKEGSQTEYTKIFLGQTFTAELNASLNGGIAAEKLLSRNSTGEQEDIYCYDTEDFDNFLILYVKEGKIVAWQTTSDCLGVYNGTELIQGSSASSYEKYDEWMQSINGPYIPKAEIVSDAIEIGDIYFGGLVSSKDEWDLNCGNDLIAEEQLCEYTINALRVMNGKSILSHNQHLYGDGKTYGMKAWAETMAVASEVTHGVLEKGPLANKTTTERGTDIFNGSGKTVVSETENVLGEAFTGGETAANEWYLSLGHSQALMSTSANDGRYKETTIMAAAVYKEESGKTYWAWTNGRYKIDYGTPVLTLSDVNESSATVEWTDILTQQGYEGSYIVEFSLYEDFSSIYKRAEWNATPYTRTGLTAGTTYYVRVKARPVVNGVVQESNWSNTVEITIPAETPAITESDIEDEAAGEGIAQEPQEPAALPDEITKEN